MAALRFTSIIKLRDPNPYILVTPIQAKTIKPGWRKSLPVLVRVNDKPAVPWCINMMPVGDGSFCLYLHGDVRKASGTKVGDRVRVEVGFDAKYRNGPQHPVPSWFKAALQKNPRAAKNWEALIPSRKKETLRYFARLKSPDARERNLEKALHVLSGRKGRFMARVESRSLAAAGFSSAAAAGRSGRRRTRASIPRVRRRSSPD
jgi:hypothetical protein